LMVLNSCQRILGNRHDAEDAAQAVFMVLWNSASDLTSRKCIAGWLYHVTHNVCRNMKRMQKTRRTHERVVAENSVQDHTVHDRPDETTASDIRDVLDEELRQMSESYRLPLILFYLENRSQDEIASRLEMKRTTVASRIARGRKILRERLSRRGVSVGIATLTTFLGSNTCSASLERSFLATTS
jgi:RNA polymerase sigma factor (sigma-70 family)